MKKVVTMLALVLGISCFMPSSVYGKDYIQDIENTKLIEVNEEDFKPVDYLDGALALESDDLLHSNNARTPGDLLYESFYVKVPARTSVRVGNYLSEFYGDAFKLEWDGATNYDPDIDIVIENLQDGSQWSWVDNAGGGMHQNKGNIIFRVNYTGYFRIWLRSLNYSDVTFYRVSTFDY